MVIATGAQGEGNAVLSRIITGSHKNVRLKKSDTVILSSSIIPGNEATIQKLKDELYRQSDNVIHGELMDIHVSGHGNREDIKFILDTVKPDYFIPVYAYHYMLREAAKLARDSGFKPEKILVLDNGQIAEFDGRSGHATDTKVDTSAVFVDGLGVGDVGNVVLKDRQVMASDGMVVVVVQVNTKTRKVMGNPDIITRGFIHIKTSEKLMHDIRNYVKKTTESILQKKMPKKNEDWGDLRAKLRDDLGKFLFKETEREPMVLPVVLKV
ncbi:MAG: ribonuclease J [Parcubacteria group bacterium]|nr:ribonuclease J [Parcubacteria group bacterium]